ncbi:MAG: LamB/YcsF family protein [Synergistaceae bacterium]|nr:LamB/YcsF family protein [Synergistaceae bacterium]
MNAIGFSETDESKKTVDVNSDLGESFGVWSMGDDEAILSCVSSANVACGYHAGDPSIMKRTVALCASRGVAIGGHVSFPDLLGFGRRNMSCDPDEVYDYCLYQIGALSAFCRAGGVSLDHVKAHGALYNQAAKDAKLARAVAAAARDGGVSALLGLAGSEFEAAARDAGLSFASEVFADRAYSSDGSLLPRSLEGAVLHDVALVAKRAVTMVTEGRVETADGAEIKLRPDSICLHGDAREAVDMALAVRRALEEAGVTIAPARRRFSR